MHARRIETSKFKANGLLPFAGETLKAPILHEMLRRAKVAILSASRTGSSGYAASRRPEPYETRWSASLSSVGIITSPLDVPHDARFLACSELEFLRTIFKKSHPE